jgi:hypothetical protein
VSDKQNDIAERTSVTESGTQHLPEAACADLSALPSVGIARAEWDGIEGLALSEVVASPVVEGQPALKLIVAAVSGRHRLGIAFRGLSPDRTYRATVWMKAEAKGHLILDVRDGTSQAGRFVAFSLEASRGEDVADDPQYDLQSGDGWFRPSIDVHSADGVAVVYAGLAEEAYSQDFRGDGRRQLTFGGIDLVPLEHSEILHAQGSATLQHFILTKFGFGVQNENWYDGVLSLFEAVTYPSLCAQTSQKFTWLIVVDAQIPRPAVSRLRQIVGRARNIHIVPLDLTNLRHVRHGCFDFIWDRCQDYIIEHRLLTEPSDYVVTSAIDSDDALHRNTVELVNQHSARELARLVANESSRPTVIRHTCGQVLTFPSGLQWYAQADVVQPLKFEFQGMAVFVLARFSSSISAFSCDHSEWSAMARALKFDVKKVQLDRPMWVYVRHERSQMKWQIEAPESDSSCIEILHRDFGIDFAKVEAWRASSALQRMQAQPARHVGLSGREQHDCYFRIAALNRQIAVLEQKKRQDGLDDKDELLILKQREARRRLLERFQRQGQQLYQ